jgi:hypothetical protein
MVSSSGGMEAAVLSREDGSMPDANLERRVAILEENMKQLEEVPARVTALESQIVQLRTEMHHEFSAVRTEMRTEFSAVRAEMHSEFSAVRGEMRSEFSVVRAEMRVLHEEVMSRLALLQERGAGDRPGTRDRSSPRKKR